MKRFGILLLLLLVALFGAWLWRVVSVDPGYVLITLRGFSVETTLVVALVIWLAIWFVLRLVIGMLRAPGHFWSHHRRHVTHECLADGLVALHQGRWHRAEKLLVKASKDRQHRLPALLGAARAAQERGDDERADELLTQASEGHDQNTIALVAAEQYLQCGETGRITALFDSQPIAALPPRALEIYLAALVDTGRAQEAASLLPTLRNSRVTGGKSLERQESVILAAAMQQAPNFSDLAQLWSGLSRAQKADPHIVAAYARSAMAFGENEEAITAVEKALHRQWSAELVDVFGHLPRSGKRSPLKTAEAWLDEHPNDPALLLTLARLCRKEQLWGKATEYVQRARAQGIGAAAWEELGHIHAAQDQDAPARAAYAKALAVRDADFVALAAIDSETPQLPLSHQTAVDARSDMGVPLLTDDSEPRH